jgi:8-oxo-dGTP pyrophosphatase MutT (NUDIX family)
MPRQETSAGGVVWRRRRGRTEVILAVRRDRHTDLRTTCLPKGHLERGESPAEAAVRETVEETGVTVRLGEPLGRTEYVFTHPKSGEEIAKRVHFFLMEWQAGEPHPADGELERVFWCEIDEARRALTHEGERRIVDAAQRSLSGRAADA